MSEVGEGGLQPNVMFCLSLDGPITGPSGGRGLISGRGGGAYKQNDSSVYKN